MMKSINHCTVVFFGTISSILKRYYSEYWYKYQVPVQVSYVAYGMLRVVARHIRLVSIHDKLVHDKLDFTHIHRNMHIYHTHAV